MPDRIKRNRHIIQGEVTALSPPSLQVRSHGARAMGLIGRGGPAPGRRARSLEAGLLLLLRLRAAHARTRPHAGKWGGGGSSSLPSVAPCARVSRAGAHMRMDGDGAPRRRARRVPHGPTCNCARGNQRGRGWLAGCLDADLPRAACQRGRDGLRPWGMPTSRELRLRRRRLLPRRCARLAFGCWRPRALALAR